MKKLLVGLLVLGAISAFAGDYIQNGVYATHSKYCAVKTSLNQNSDTLVFTAVNNPYHRENCKVAGEVHFYKYGKVKLNNGESINAYYELCEGASNTWCKAVEVINSETFIQYAGETTATYYLY